MAGSSIKRTLKSDLQRLKAWARPFFDLTTAGERIALLVIILLLLIGSAARHFYFKNANVVYYSEEQVERLKQGQRP